MYRKTFAVGLAFHPFHLLAAIAIFNRVYQHDSIFGKNNRLDLHMIIPVIIVNFLANFYVLCCINSLHEVIREENKRKNSKLRLSENQIKVNPKYSELLVHKPPRGSKIVRAVP